MNIDKKAPLKARKEVVIDAPFEKVWAVLTGIDRCHHSPDTSDGKIK